jgi:hypothetical protein
MVVSLEHIYSRSQKRRTPMNERDLFLNRLRNRAYVCEGRDPVCDEMFQDGLMTRVGEELTDNIYALTPDGEAAWRLVNNRLTTTR